MKRQSHRSRLSLLMLSAAPALLLMAAAPAQAVNGHPAPDIPAGDVPADPSTPVASTPVE